MGVLAHVRSAFALSNGTYGSPRMVRELRDGGLAIGRRRTARLMYENGMNARQKRRFKRTTDSMHALDALRRAVALRRPPAGLVHHADRGSQYCPADYQAALKKHGIQISMSGRGIRSVHRLIASLFPWTC